MGSCITRERAVNFGWWTGELDAGVGEGRRA